MRVWDEEQTRLFLGEAKRSSPHYPLYLAAVTTGMRQGELLGLRRQDVDLTLGVVSEGNASTKADCAVWHPFGLVFCQANGRPLHAHNITQGRLPPRHGAGEVARGTLQAGRSRRRAAKEPAANSVP